MGTVGSQTKAPRIGAATYKEACEDRGLLFDDKEWDNVLCDAAELQMPRQMRDCFVTILMFNNRRIQRVCSNHTTARWETTCSIQCAVWIVAAGSAVQMS